MKKLLVILGPTATGKTDLGLKFAKEFNGELVSCDSRQVYKGLDIGTGKEPSKQFAVHTIQKGDVWWKIEGVKIWMYDVADPKTRYTVKDYIDEASKVIDDIHQRAKLPIIVGGTGLYFKALLEGLPNLEIPIDEQLRGELEKLSLEELQQRLQTLSPARWKSLNNSDRNNPRRLLRSIEVVIMNPNSRTVKNSNPIQSDSKLKVKNYNLLRIGLTAEREILKKRIFERLLIRLDQGMIEEAAQLHKGGLSFERMRELGLEYGMLAEFLEGRIDKNTFISKLAAKIGQYAKRQMVWFKNPSSSSTVSLPNCSGQVNWFDITKKDYLEKVEKLASSWYHSENDKKN